MTRLDAILLDLDGVLVASEPAHLWAWTELLRGEGVDFSAADYRRVGAGRPREAVIRAMLGPIAPTEHERLMQEKAGLVERFIAEHGLDPVPGALDFARSAQEAGIGVAVATSSRDPGLLLRAIGARDQFEVVVDRTMVARGKPAPDLFLLAAQRLSIDPHACWVVEDAPAGVEAGLAAGCHVLAVTTTHERHDLQQAHQVIDHFDEVHWNDLVAWMAP
ncbi:MAG: HAD family phosphatase [Deltaproteobacteria bacterium]|nr:HAD family phosphatase [Deltaproteobacteria bacterium]